MESLTIDLLLEIFLKLPCKDIVVSKCVCKEWYDLLSDPIFSVYYMRIPPFTSIFVLQLHRTSSCLLLEVGRKGGVIQTPLRSKIPNFEPIDPWLRPPEAPRSDIIGTWNGLLFFCQWTTGSAALLIEKVYSYDPLSGDCVLLVEQEWPRGLFDLWSVKYRIGFVTGHVKLLRIVMVQATLQSHILTVGIDSGWRGLEDRVDHHYDFKGVTFKGAYHWIHEGTYPASLKTFGFEEEKIGPDWKLPDQLGEDKWRTRLVVVNNHISVVENPSRLEMVVWIMEEYGVGESWSKRIVLGNYLNPNVAAIFFIPNRNGEEIMAFDAEQKDGTFKIEEIETPKNLLYTVKFTPRFHPLDQC